MKKEEIKACLDRITAKLKHSKIILGTGVIVIIIVVALSFMLNKGDKRIPVAYNQVWQLADNIRGYYRSRPDAWGLNSEKVISEKMVPQEMLNNKLLVNALGKEVLVGADLEGNTVMPGSRSFAIVYKNLNESECQEIAAADLGEKEQLTITSIIIANDTETQFVWGGEHPLPISGKDAKSFCRKNNIITWFLYI